MFKPRREADSRVTAHWKPLEYDQRHIMGLVNVSEWSKKDIEAHLSHNRMLQPGFLRRPAQAVIYDAKATHTEWLTDSICPAIGPAVRLHIAAELVYRYQIAPDALAEQVNVFYDQLMERFDFEALEEAIQREAAKQKAKDLPAAKRALAKIYPEMTEKEEGYRDLLGAFLRIEADRRLKQATQTVLMNDIPQRVRAVADRLHIPQKPLKARGENTDYLFLGAAGSGKSTIARQYLSRRDEVQSIIIATDNYRAVEFGHIDHPLTQQQAFIKSQDTAYLIKELVQKKCELAAKGERPDLILDGVTYERWLDPLIHGNRATHALMACLGEAKHIAPRAYRRAADRESAPADRGRYVNTTALIEGHKLASARLLSGLPAHHPEVILYSTDVPKGQPPRRIADINTREHSVTIDDLEKLGHYLGKMNLNPEATHQSDIYYYSHLMKDRFKFTPAHQASAILSLIPAGPHKPEYALILRDRQGRVYVTLTDQGIILTESGQSLLKALRQRQSITNDLSEGDQAILKMLIIQSSAYKNTDHLTVKQRLDGALKDLGVFVSEDEQKEYCRRLSDSP